MIIKETTTSQYVQPVKAEVADPLTPESRPSIKRTPPKSFSIKSVVSGTPKEAESSSSQSIREEVVSEIPNSSVDEEDIVVLDVDTPFDQDELDDAWKAYTNSYLKDKPKYSSLTNSYIPVLKEEYVLQISFENTFQLELFREFKHELAIFLRKKLNNSLISFAEEVVEQGNSKSMIYTVDDKFRFMSQKNPNLLKLKQQLNLDFD